jgi:PIN domain-containing protein
MQYHHRVTTSLVVDTDVMVAALPSDRGASRQLLLAAFERRFEMLLSVPLILEYEAVLNRPEHLAACGLSRPMSSAFLMTWRQSRGRFALLSGGVPGCPTLMTIWSWRRQSMGTPAQL